MKSHKNLTLLTFIITLPFAASLLQAQIAPAPITTGAPSTASSATSTSGSTAEKALAKAKEAVAAAKEKLGVRKDKESDQKISGASSTVIALKDPVAVVDGAKISKADLEKAFKEAVASSNMNPATLTADQKIQGYHQILDALIMEKLVDKKSSGVEVSDADVSAEIDKIKKQFPTPDAFNAELKKSGQTTDLFTANLKKSMRQTKWMKEQIQGKDTVTDADAQKFYNENIKQFENPEMVKASHILFLVPQGASDSVVKAKEAAAKAAIERANKGEDFSKLAAELSEEPGAKQRAGDLGFFSKSQMVPEFATAAFDQKVGSVSATPVKTKFGFHIIKVTEKKPAGTASFAEVKPNIIAYLQNQKRRAAFKAEMEQLRQAAKIENFLPAPAIITPATMKPSSLPGKAPASSPAVTTKAPATPTPSVTNATPSPVKS
ncbi:MAG: peptidylprolyl isomerase [Verrucomicrobiae bacterium]|jgi:peptidyl-prolyl cis-trans isomerase C|nr:peptidylprolyl isomerase [Verrucomicrobiae bacterium]